MYKITDKVETGYLHNDCKGGTLHITFNYSTYNSEIKSEVLRTIDYLDHSLITSNSDALQFSERFFLLEKTENIFNDVLFILYDFISKIYISNVVSISVRLNNETVELTKDELKLLSNRLIKYSVNG